MPSTSILGLPLGRGRRSGQQSGGSISVGARMRSSGCTHLLWCQIATREDGTHASLLRRTRALLAGSRKYGHDPRRGDARRTTADEGELGSWQPTPPGELSNLENIAQLEAALSEVPIVVLKFVRKGCPACASTAEQYEAAAKTYRDSARFYLVDYKDAKTFCQQCSLKVVPAAHIYVEGSLQVRMACAHSSWSDFATRLARKVVSVTPK